MRKLIVMMMMMLLQTAVAHDEYKAQQELIESQVWLLVMVTAEGDMMEWTRHGLWSSCVSKGTEELKRHLMIGAADDNPYRYNGFFCDKDVPEPEPVSMLMPMCLSPMKECA